MIEALPRKVFIKTIVPIASIGGAAISIAKAKENISNEQVLEYLENNPISQDNKANIRTLSALEKSVKAIENSDVNLDNIDLEQYGKNGIPLKYSRAEFIKDILETLNGLSVQEKSEIFLEMT